MKINGDTLYLSLNQVVANTNDQTDEVKVAIYASILANAGWTAAEFVQYCDHLKNEILLPESINHTKWVN